MASASSDAAKLVGDNTGTNKPLGEMGSPGHVLAHAALGCAAAAATGKDCAPGALGGGASALVGSFLPDPQGLGDKALMAGALTFTGGVAAQALGYDGVTAGKAASNEALNNRLLHVSERRLLLDRARQITQEQAKAQGVQLSSEQRQAVTEYWYGLLSAEATAGMDAISARERGAYLNQVASARQPGLEGYFSADSYLNDAAYARAQIASMAGALIPDDKGQPIVADGGVLRTFQATTQEQYQDFRLFGTTNGATLLAQFGQGVDFSVYRDALASAYANQQARLVTQNNDRQRLEQLSTRNGSATPMNVVEENLLLGMVAKGAGMAFNGVNSVLAARAAVVRQSVGRAVANSGTTGGSSFIFGGDGRSPEIIFSEGFQSTGANTDLYLKASENVDSIFVSTSKSPNVAREFAGYQGDGYVYTIRGQPQGVDVNAVLGSRSPFPHELEIAVPGGIKPVDVMGARQIGPNGRFIGPFIKNPNHKCGSGVA